MKNKIVLKAMSRTVMGMAFFVGILALCGTVSAHPPFAMDLIYDAKNGVLKVDIAHIVKRPKKHYVRKIEIYKDNEKIDEKFLTWQKTSGINIDFNVLAEDGDVLKVRAICKKGGLKTAEIKVEIPEEDDDSKE